MPLYTKLDNSMIKSWRDCPYQCHWRYREHLVLSGERKSALFFGDVWHRCISMLWLTDWNFERALEMADALWDPLRGDAKRTKERLVSALAAYATNDEYLEDFHKWELAADEIFVEVPLTDEVTYCGNIDKVLRNGDKWVVLDHKTSTWNHVCDKAYELEPQFIGYTWMLHQDFDIPLANTSFCLDMLFMQGKENKLFRRNIYYSEDRVMRWLAETRLIVSQMNTIKPWHNPRCSDFGDCPYYYLCTCDGRSDEEAAIKEAMYIEEKWNFKQPEDKEPK